MADESLDFNLNFTSTGGQNIVSSGKPIIDTLGTIGAMAQGASGALYGLAGAYQTASTAASKLITSQSSIARSIGTVANNVAPAAGIFVGGERGNVRSSTVYGGYAPSKREQREERSYQQRIAKEALASRNALIYPSPIGPALPGGRMYEEPTAKAQRRASEAEGAIGLARQKAQADWINRYNRQFREGIAQNTIYEKKAAKERDKMYRDAYAENIRRDRASAREARQKQNQMYMAEGIRQNKALGYADKPKQSMLGKFGGVFEKALYVAPAWMMVRGAINTVKAAVSSTIETMVDWESTMGRIKAVTSGTEADYSRLSRTILDVGKSFGNSTDELAAGALQWASAGYAVDDLGILLENTAKLATLSNQNIGTSVDDLISIMKSYDMQAQDTGSIVDMVTKIQMKYVISTKDLITAMRNFAPVAANAGVSMESAMGLLAGMEQKTKAAGGKLGTAMSTIFTRLNTVSIDAMQGIAHIPMYLDNAGNAVFRNTGKLRLQSDVLLELGAKWDSYGSAVQAAIGKAVSGTRNINLFTSLVKEMRTAFSATVDAAGAAGTANKALDPILETTEKKVGKLSASWKSLVLTVGDTSDIKKAVDLLTQVVQVTEAGIAASGNSTLGFFGKFTMPGMINETFLKSKETKDKEAQIGAAFLTTQKVKQESKSLLAEDERLTTQKESQVSLSRELIRALIARKSALKEVATAEDEATKLQAENAVSYYEGMINEARKVFPYLGIDQNITFEELDKVIRGIKDRLEKEKFYLEIKFEYDTKNATADAKIAEELYDFEKKSKGLNKYSKEYEELRKRQQKNIADIQTTRVTLPELLKTATENKKDQSDNLVIQTQEKKYQQEILIVEQTAQRLQLDKVQTAEKLLEVTAKYRDTVKAAAKDEKKFQTDKSVGLRKEAEERQKLAVELAKDYAKIGMDREIDRQNRRARNVSFLERDPNSGKYTRRQVEMFGDVSRETTTTGRIQWGIDSRRRGVRGMSRKERLARNAETIGLLQEENKRAFEEDRLRSVAGLMKLSDKELKKRMESSKYVTNLVGGSQYGQYFTKQQQALAAKQISNNFNMPINITLTGNLEDWEKTKKEIEKEVADQLDSLSTDKIKSSSKKKK